MRKLALLLIDVGLIASATVGALLLRDNFELSEARLAALLPYLAITLAVALVALTATGIGRSVWRFTTLADYLRILAATVATVALAVALGFGLNRLEGVPRALPVLQGVLMLALLVGGRVAMRLRHEQRRRSSQLSHGTHSVNSDGETVLVVGLSRLTDLYVRAVAELAGGRMRIAGVLGRTTRHTGRSVLGHPIIGTPEQVRTILRDLDVHGVAVGRIVIGLSFNSLSPLARAELLDIERTTSVKLDILPELLGLAGTPVPSGAESRHAAGSLAFTLRPEQLASLEMRPYWRLKRALDLVLSAILLLAISPLVVFVAVLVAVDVGFPVAFWQQRPGLAGRPFRLYKFRTMAAAHDDSGERVPDAQRLSAIGRILRRTRLDELPQMLCILRGEMSFIGPRPLLPVDQPAEFAARLLVRPGLTGWAQVRGGREISASDKAALDVWYVQNAGLWLDFRILLATVPMVIFGERPNAAAIARAWRELREAGICAPFQSAAEDMHRVLDLRESKARRAA
jgi:lipopolysaccharide/colanic/teichoic acid biosynthesis glycosyltransferase